MPRFIAVVTNLTDDIPTMGLLLVEAPDLASAEVAVAKNREGIEGTPCVLDVDTVENIKKFIDEVAAGDVHVTADQPVSG